MNCITVYNDRGREGAASPEGESLIPRLLKSLFRGPTPSSERLPEKIRHHIITNPWHAVSVVPCPRACEAVRNLGRNRFLSKEAPELPLADCGAKGCHCHYRHHPDRRASARRGEDFFDARPYWAGKERRSTRGRRNTDT